MRPFKELEINNSNKDGFERATIQRDSGLECLKAIDGHATIGVLKR
jgi:hypothetical protein